MMYEYTEPQDLQTQRDILDDTDDVDYYDTDRAETKDQRQSEAEARRYLRRRLSTYH